MRIDVRAIPEADPSILEPMKQRLRLSLGRFGGKVRRIYVSLEQTSPGGSLCRMRAVLSAHDSSVVVEDRDVDLVTAAQRAADRLTRGVTRAFERQRMGGRPLNPL